jgi:hypothetical protein
MVKKRAYSQMAQFSVSRKMESKLLSLLMVKKISCFQMAPRLESTQTEKSGKLIQTVRLSTLIGRHLNNNDSNIYTTTKKKKVRMRETTYILKHDSYYKFVYLIVF